RGRVPERDDVHRRLRVRLPDLPLHPRLRRRRAAAPLRARERASYSSASRRASNEPDQSSAWNSSTVAAASPSNRCCTTPTSRSFTNGTSTGARETRLTDTFPHAGQRTASATRSPLAAGASSLNADGNTGRGRSSGQQKKSHGQAPALIRAAA